MHLDAIDFLRLAQVGQCKVSFSPFFVEESCILYIMVLMGLFLVLRFQPFGARLRFIEIILGDFLTDIVVSVADTVGRGRANKLLIVFLLQLVLIHLDWAALKVVMILELPEGVFALDKKKVELGELALIFLRVDFEIGMGLIVLHAVG